MDSTTTRHYIQTLSLSLSLLNRLLVHYFSTFFLYSLLKESGEVSAAESVPLAWEEKQECWRAEKPVIRIPDNLAGINPRVKDAIRERARSTLISSLRRRIEKRDVRRGTKEGTRERGREGKEGGLSNKEIAASSRAFRTDRDVVYTFDFLHATPSEMDSCIPKKGCRRQAEGAGVREMAGEIKVRRCKRRNGASHAKIWESFITGEVWGGRDRSVWITRYDLPAPKEI